MRRQPDTLQWALPEPSTFVVDEGLVSWRRRPLEPWAFSRTDTSPADAVPSIRGLLERGPLDEFVLLSRGTEAQRRKRAVLLARTWGSPLSLCAICRRQHKWDRVTLNGHPDHAPELKDSWWFVEEPPLQVYPPGSYLGDKGAQIARAGSEPIDDWLAWANVINAIRRVSVANRAGRDGDPDDVALFWPGPPAAAQRVLVAAVVNQWLSATCVSPALGYAQDAPLGTPPIRVVPIGSVLAALGWAFREEMAAESGTVLACPFVLPDGKVCGMTERLERAGTRTRELCELHYATQGKRDERALAAVLADPDDERQHVTAESSLDGLAAKGVVPDESGEIHTRRSGFQDEWDRSDERPAGSVERVGRS